MQPIELSPLRIELLHMSAPGVIASLQCYRDKVAWQEEFWPTTAAEYVLHLLWTLSKRALWLSDPESRQSYVAAVPKVSKHAQTSCSAQLQAQWHPLQVLCSPGMQ